MRETAVTPVVPVVGLGAGGHAAVMVEALRAAGYDVVALSDPRRELWGSTLLGVPIVGDDAALSDQYHPAVARAFIGLGGVSDSTPRRRLFAFAQAEGFDVVTFAHPSAVLSPSARLATGVSVLAMAMVNANVVLEDNVLVNTGAIVEHDCEIGESVHVAIGARLASGVHVGAGAHIGAGATVLQGLSIGENAVVGAGAVVTRDVRHGVTVVGVPARPMNKASA